jgi:hypothetical protein
MISILRTANRPIGLPVRSFGYVLCVGRELGAADASLPVQGALSTIDLALRFLRLDMTASSHPTGVGHECTALELAWAGN